MISEVHRDCRKLYLTSWKLLGHQRIELLGEVTIWRHFMLFAMNLVLVDGKGILSNANATSDFKGFCRQPRAFLSSDVRLAIGMEIVVATF